MNEKRFIMNRRQVVASLATGVAATTTPGFMSRALSVPKTIKIGIVQPSTGPFAFFTEHMPFVLDQVKKATGGNVTVNGLKHPFEIIIKDSQSNPNRASEVTQELILKDGVDLIATFATPETVNPVSDQCEINGVPCVSNDAPLEPYFFGRHGDLKVGWEWTYHFFFSGRKLADAIAPFYHKLKPGGVIGGL